MPRRLLDLVKNIFSGPRSAPAFAAAAFVAAALFSLTGIAELFELKLADVRFRLKPPLPPWEMLACVDINEDSINAVGEYPWTRNIYAAGVAALRELKVSRTTLDIIFPDESPYQVNMAALRALGEKARGVDPSTLILDHDRTFTKALTEAGNVIVPYVFSTDPPGRDALARLDTPAFREALPAFLERSSRAVPEKERGRYGAINDRRVKALIYPIPPVMASARAFGFVDRDSDADGVIRKIRLVRYYKGRIYFNLALAMLADMCGVSPANVEVTPGSRITLKGAVHPRTGKKGDLSIPVDSQGMMYVNWAGTWQKSFMNVPFHALIDYDDYSGDAFDAMEAWEDSRNVPEEKRAGELYRALGEALDAPPGSAARARAGALRRDLAAAYGACARDLKKAGDTQNARAVELVAKLQSLAGAHAVVGWTAVSAHDIGVVPVQNDYPRVGTYHNAVNTALSGRFIRRPGLAYTLPVMLALALGTGFLMRGLDARKSLIAMGISFVAVNAAVYALFIGAGIWAEQLALSLASLLPSLSITAVKFVGEESQRRFIKNAFSQYLSPEVIENIIDNPESLRLGGESRVITVFFSDVQGFTSLSERMSPGELVSFLNEYLSAMTDIILSHGGTVDKFIGDAIMAFYGAPHDLPDHAVRACLATVDMKRALRDLQDRWRSGGQEEIRMRIGMHTGEAVVGNMGSRSRMNYTAMGDTVNLASRLEGANKYYGSGAMISESTCRLASAEIESRELDVIRVMGKSEPIKIHELLGRKNSLPPRMNDMLDKYERGIEYFRTRDWKQALRCFREALRAIPDDGPSRAYVERCEKFLKRPPSRDWDGVYIMKSK